MTTSIIISTRWNAAESWANLAVPDAASDVLIQNISNVTIDAVSYANTLLLNSSTLTLNSDLTIAGALTGTPNSGAGSYIDIDGETLTAASYAGGVIIQGYGVVNGDIIEGRMSAINGTLRVNGNSTSGVYDFVSNGATLEINNTGAYTKGIAFWNTTGTADVVLYNPTQFTGGFTGVNLGVQIHLVGINAVTAHLSEIATGSYNLELGLSDGRSLSYHVAGSLLGNTAVLTSDGNGGTFINFAPFFSSFSNGVSQDIIPTIYTGPVPGLRYELIDGTQNAVIVGSTSNEFIKLSSINSVGKAVDGNGGSDVIDGGVGSTFMSGGAGHSGSTFFLDGRVSGATWSTITDFRTGSDQVTIWGFIKGVSSVDASFADPNNDGAVGYTGLTLHFKNLLPSGQSTGTNVDLNSITLSGLTLADIGASSLADLNNQIDNASYIASTGQYHVNSHLLIGQTNDALGTHGYLFIH